MKESIVVYADRILGLVRGRVTPELVPFLLRYKVQKQHRPKQHK